MINANNRNIDMTTNNVVASVHDPIILAFTTKAKQGVLTAGLIVAKDDKNELVPYDSTSTKTEKNVVGVLTETIDTNQDTTAIVLVHGSVKKATIKHKTNDATSADFASLMSAGIYAI